MLSHITTPIENNTSLMNKDNYLSSLQNNLHELLTIQFNLFHEYDKHINETYIPTHSQDSLHIYITGFKTIFNIYHYLLLYTKNTQVSYNQCHNAVYLYVEFVNQIMDDNNVYLKLNVSDAVIFIYKKTIFELNKSYCKCIPGDLTIQEKDLYDILNLNGRIINHIIIYIYENINENNSNTKNDQVSIKNISDYLPDISLIFKNNVSYDFDYNKYKCLLYFLEILQDYFNTNYSNEQYLECIQKFCRHLKNKSEITQEKMREKMYSSQSFENNMITLSQLVKLFD